jgi:hypothetical protein
LLHAKALLVKHTKICFSDWILLGCRQTVEPGSFVIGLGNASASLVEIREAYLTGRIAALRCGLTLTHNAGVDVFFLL